MKSIILSVKPQEAVNILNGEQTILIAKSTPKETPFKVYVYCTGGIGKKVLDVDNVGLYRWSGIRLIKRSVDKGWLKDRPDETTQILLDYGRTHPLHKSDYELNGKVVAEFVCDKVSTIDFAYGGVKEELERELQGSCLTNQEARDYFLTSKGSTRKNLKLYGGHISELKIYDKPKELGEFKVRRKRSYYAIPYDANSYMKIDRLEKITRPPQSWQYIETLE